MKINSPTPWALPIGASSFSPGIVSAFSLATSKWSGYAAGLRPKPAGLRPKPTIWATPSKTNQPLLHVGLVTLTGMYSSPGVEEDQPINYSPVLDSRGNDIRTHIKDEIDWREEYANMDDRYKVLQCPSFIGLDGEHNLNENSVRAGWEQWEMCYRKKERLLEAMEYRARRART